MDTLVDFANTAHEEVGKFQLSFFLSPQLLTTKCPVDELKWTSIAHGTQELAKVPDDKRGIYAFAITSCQNAHPPNCYILYVGIAGKDSQRSLRSRYRDYLNEKKVLKRTHIAHMIGTWHSVLRFFFAPIDDSISAADLKALEKNLNDCLLPPFSKGDLSADVKRKRNAFR